MRLSGIGGMSSDDVDHGEDWALAAVELASQCNEWSKGQI
jgi:6,7-dimethyl-8-ribityllumazine synthase